MPFGTLSSRGGSVILMSLTKRNWAYGKLKVCVFGEYLIIEKRLINNTAKLN